jgi:hypothetical protein
VKFFYALVPGLQQFPEQGNFFFEPVHVLLEGQKGICAGTTAKPFFIRAIIG